MRVSGLTTDVFVTDPDAAWSFWRAVMGRAPDLTPSATMVEWKLYVEPEINLRVEVDEARAGSARIGLGVDDLQTHTLALRERLPDVPDPEVKPGVITWITLLDPDGNEVVVWQDLLPSRRR